MIRKKVYEMCQQNYKAGMSYSETSLIVCEMCLIRGNNFR